MPEQISYKVWQHTMNLLLSPKVTPDDRGVAHEFDLFGSSQ